MINELRNQLKVISDEKLIQKQPSNLSYVLSQASNQNNDYELI